MLRIVTTENSIWFFNLEEATYRRVPREYDHRTSPVALIPYNDEWESFDELVEPGQHQWGDDRLLVIRPVPMGEGHLRLTGPITSDELSEEGK